MQLEVGKTYINRRGEEVPILSEEDSGDYPFNSDVECYTRTGRAWLNDETDDDLIKEKEYSSDPKQSLGIKKPAISNVPGSALIHQSIAHKYGHKKYGYFNWRKSKVEVMVYLDAALRHLFSYIDGEDFADDSGVHHLAHAAANCNIVLDALEIGNLIDNRPPKGLTSEIIYRMTT